MRYLQIEGPCRIEGKINVPGAKNSVLALLPAALLTNDIVEIKNVPPIRDVAVIRSIFNDLGVISTYDNGSITIDPSNIHYSSIHKEKATQYRASYYFIGALISRFPKLSIGLPGGDDFGSRPIDQHLKGLRALGVRITEKRDGLLLEVDRLIGADIYFDVITSGATMNVIMAAVKAKGKTVIHNAARDPEIVDLCNLLNKMGAKIKGAGTDTIRIEGVDHLNGCSHTAIPDRLVAGTFLIAALATDGELTVDGIIPEHLSPLLRKLDDMNASFTVGEESIHVSGKQRLKATRVRTGMYPRFATDLQQPLTALMLRAAGKSIITETIYPNRFSHVAQLQRMGAAIERRNDSAFIQGGNPLVGADVAATDVRAGISLLIAAMMAEGRTRIFGVEHIERGYGDIVGDFTGLRAKISYGELDESDLNQTISWIG